MRALRTVASAKVRFEPKPILRVKGMFVGHCKFPRISLVTTSLNQGSYLRKSIQSVLGQGYPDLEYMVLDGGSEDGSEEIIRHYESRLAFWRSAPDKGQADAIMTGFQMATGQILGWLNSDDLLLPGSLEKVGRFFVQNPRVDCVVGGGILIDAEGRPIPIRNGRPGFTLGTRQHFRKLLCWEAGGFYQPASFWRREAFFRVGGFDTSLRFCFDRDMYLRLAKEKPFGLIPEFLACYRLHGQSKTSTLSELCLAERLQVLERHGLMRIPAFYRYLSRRAFVLSDSLRKRHLLRRYHSGGIVFPRCLQDVRR